MTANDLIAAFDTLAEAPDGVKRLRELVLQLAVRGKLVEQDSADGTVVDTLASVKKERLRAGSLSAERVRDFGTLAPKDWPFEPPKSWRMLRFGDVFIDVFTGPFGTSLKAHEYRRGGTPVVNPQNLRNGVIVPTEDTCVGPETLMRLQTFVISDRDIVVARRGEMGRCAVVTPREVGWLCGTGSLVLRPPNGVAPRFVAAFLGSPWTVDRLGGDSVGSTMKNLNQKILANLPFGLPPLAEQHRIVARVDELMGLLDRLEAARTARDAVRRAVRDVALAALRDAQDTDAVEIAWGRITRQLDVIFVDPEDIGPLRRAVLALAMRGRLASQEAADEPAAKVLQRLGKTRGVGAAALVPLKPDESLLFPVASGWTWTTVGALGQDGPTSIADGPFGSKLKKEHYVTNAGFRVLRLGNVGRGRFKNEDKSYISEHYAETLSAYHLRDGDILVASLGDPPGRACMVPASVLPALNKADCFRVRPTIHVEGAFIALALNAPFGEARSLALHRGDTRGRINLSHLRSMPIPLPPREEQRRILTKVDSLMAICDTLEARLTAARDHHAQFAAAAIHHFDA